jgi:transposase InsO family protein
VTNDDPASLIEALTLSELKKALGLSGRTLRRWQRAGKFLPLPSGEAHANGKPVRAVLPSTLPPRLRDRLLQHLRRAAALPARRKTAALPPPHKGSDLPGLLPGRPGLADVPLTPGGAPDAQAMRALGFESAADGYARRAAAVAALIAALDTVARGGRSKVFATIAVDYAISPRSLRRWHAAFLRGGARRLLGILPADRQRRYSLPDDLKRAILDHQLTPSCPTARETFDEVVLPRYVARREPPPSYSTVARFLRRILPLVRAAFRGGPRQVERDFQPKVQRDYPAVAAVWSGDCRQLDVMIEDAGRRCRPWLCCFFDLGSATLIGWVLTRVPSAAAVCAALRKGLETHGKPQSVQSDNGLEFINLRLGGRGRRNRPAARGDTPLLPEGLLPALGIQHRRCIPKKPWGKPAESLLGAFGKRFEHRMPGYCGRSPERRPEVLAQHLKKSLLLTWQELEGIVGERAKLWNRTRPIGHRPAPPAQMYAAHLQQHPAEPLSPPALAALCQKEEERKVHAEGIQLCGTSYWSPDLAPYVGTHLKARWDPWSPGLAFCYEPGSGRLVAVIRPKPVADWSGFGPANELARQSTRKQREVLARIKVEVEGATPVEAHDPTGAFRVVAARKVQERAEHALLTAASELAAEQAAATKLAPCRGVPTDDTAGLDELEVEISKAFFWEAVHNATEGNRAIWQSEAADAEYRDEVERRLDPRTDDEVKADYRALLDQERHWDQQGEGTSRPAWLVCLMTTRLAYDHGRGRTNDRLISDAKAHLSGPLKAYLCVVHAEDLEVLGRLGVIDGGEPIGLSEYAWAVEGRRRECPPQPRRCAWEDAILRAAAIVTGLQAGTLTDQAGQAEMHEIRAYCAGLWAGGTNGVDPADLRVLAELNLLPEAASEFVSTAMETPILARESADRVRHLSGKGQ